MDALPRNNHFVILGESFSGPLAMMAAAARPPGLLGVILCATFVSSPRPFIGTLGGPLIRSSPFRLYGPYKRVRSRLGKGFSESRLTLLNEMLRLVRPHVLASRVRMVLKCDAREALRAFDPPVLYLQGTRDWVVPRGNLQRIRRIRPDVSVARIAASHMVLQQNPIAAAKAIGAFVNSQAAEDRNPGNKVRYP